MVYQNRKTALKPISGKVSVGRYQWGLEAVFLILMYPQIDFDGTSEFKKQLQGPVGGKISWEGISGKVSVERYYSSV